MYRCINVKHPGTIYQCKERLEYHNTKLCSKTEVTYSISFSDERRCNTIKKVVDDPRVTEEISKKHRHVHKLSLMNGQISFGWIKSGIFSLHTN